MKRALITVSLLLSLSLWLTTYRPVVAQQNKPAPTPAANKNLAPAEVIKLFTERESELFETWKEYAYKQESTIQVLGPANTISGRVLSSLEFVFNDAGKRMQRIIKAPPSALEQSGILTAEDKNALINLQPFALTAKELPNYNMSYVGKEKVDALDTYVFDVMPKVMGNQQELRRMKSQKIEGKFFQGRIWVDDQICRSSKCRARSCPNSNSVSRSSRPTVKILTGVTGFRPTPTATIHCRFDDGGTLHVRMVIKYKDYRQFQSDVKITGSTEEIKDESKPESKDPKSAKPARRKTRRSPKNRRAKLLSRNGRVRECAALTIFPHN
jgi:hypothetical protein